MLQAIENEPSYVFNVREYKENSVIASVLTLNHGRISVMVRGSAARSALQPFAPLKLTLAPSKTDLFFLQDFECCGESYNFKMPIFFCATYLNELLYHLYNSKECSPLLFGTYVATLEALNQQKHIESSLRKFELTLLETLGYGLSSQDQDGNNLQPQQLYRFGVGMGFIAVDAPVKAHSSKQEFLRTIANLQAAPPNKEDSSESTSQSTTTDTNTSVNTTSATTSSVSSWSDEELEDAMRFSKRKVKGPSIASYSYATNTFSQVQYSGLVTPEGRPIAINELLGPALLGSVLSKIIQRQFDADTLKQSKELTNALFNFLLGKREIKSRQLYKDYMQVQAAKNAAKEAALKNASASGTTATTQEQASGAGAIITDSTQSESTAYSATTESSLPQDKSTAVKIEPIPEGKIEASKSLLEAGAKASATLKEQQEQQKQQKAQEKQSTRRRKSSTAKTKKSELQSTGVGEASLSEQEMVTTLVAWALNGPELEPSAALLESEAKAKLLLQEQLEQAKKPKKRSRKSSKTATDNQD